jgi:hypothetical protein
MENGEILDMDEGKRKEKKNGQLNFSLVHKSNEKQKISFCSSLMMILFIV